MKDNITNAQIQTKTTIHSGMYGPVILYNLITFLRNIFTEFNTIYTVLSKARFPDAVTNKLHTPFIRYEKY